MVNRNSKYDDQNPDQYDDQPPDQYDDDQPSDEYDDQGSQIDAESDDQGDYDDYEEEEVNSSSNNTIKRARHKIRSRNNNVWNGCPGNRC